MSRWRCRFYRTLLVDYAGGMLTDRQRQRLEGHVERCPACAEELAALRDVPPILHSSVIPDPGEEFWRQQREAIGQALRNLPAPQPSWLPAWWWEGLRLSVWRYPLAATAALLVALFVHRFAEYPQTPPPNAAESQFAALDTDSLLVLRDLTRALAPSYEQMLQMLPDDDTLLAALPAGDLVGINPSPEAPQAVDLTESELEGIGNLVGDLS
ncbi:MAG: anti-sigma factor family protein [Candidatus Binatia bacterium]